MADFEDSPILQKLLQDFTKRVERGLREALQRENLVMTADTLNSTRAGSVEAAKGFLTSHIYYSDILRIKDMKVLNYHTIPPLAPLVKWVERVGLDSFPYVPGRPNGVGSTTETRQIYRIAQGIQYHLKATPNVQRGYRGIYNDTLKYNLLPQFYDDMREAVKVHAAQSFFEAFGYETRINLPTENLNAGRIQAAWNARDTKLARKHDR